jgi:hypothetical protein
LDHRNIICTIADGQGTHGRRIHGDGPDYFGLKK